MRSGWLLVLLLTLMACEKPAKEPLVVAQTFQDYYQQQDFSSAMPLLIDSSKPALRFLVSDLRQLPVEWPDSSRVLDGSLQVEGDRAQVNVVNWFEELADTTELALVFNGKSWRVNYQRNDPIHVARSFLEAFNSGKWQVAARFTDTESLRDLEVAAQYYKGWKGPQVTLLGAEYNSSRNKAIVSYREKGNDMVKRINLMKVEGHWKVSFSKKATF